MTTESHVEIHKLYQALTDREIPLTMAMHFQWNAWKAKGWTELDLRLVVDHIKEMIRQERRRPESFRFHHLIGDTERFNEDLSEAKALVRRPVRTNRDKVLAQAGRPEPVRENVQTVGDVIAGAKAFEEFRKFGASL